MRNFEHIDGRIVELKPLNKEGHQFDSWEVIKGDVTIKENKFTMPAEDVEVIGKYSLIPYEVIIVGENGQQSGGGIYAFNQEVLLSQSANPGYNFDGWTSDFDELVVTNDSFVMPSRNLQITANYLPINYKVIIENDGNGNETGSGDEYHVNDQVRLGAFPKTGYDFDKWEVLEGAAIVENGQFTMPAEDVKIKATYKLAEYSVTVNSGSVTNGGPFRMGDSISLLEDQKIGYSFDGWEFDVAPIEVNQGSFVMPPRNVTVTAVYTAIEYDITVNGDNGTETASESTATVGEQIALEADPEDGYEFSEWTTTTSGVTFANKDDKETTFDMPADDVTITAVYTAKEFTVTITNDGNGSGSSLGATTVNQTITLTSTPDAGYQFKEWEVVSPVALNIVNNATFTMPAENVQIKAVFELKEFTVTIEKSGETSGGVPTGGGTYTMDQSVSIDAVVAEGYEFDGWSVASGGTTLQNVSAENTTFTMPAENVVIQAAYKLKEFTVTITNDGNGSASSLGAIAVNRTITLTSTPYAGYQIKEWEVVSPVGLNIVNNATFTMPAEDVEIKAVFEAKPAYSSELGAPTARIVGTDVSLSQDGKIRAVIKGSKPIVQNYNTTNNTWEDEWAPTTITAYKVSLSADGTILAVGYNNFDDKKGKVVVYENDNGNWQQKGSQLTGEKGEWVGNSSSVQNYQFQGDRFGNSLALSNDGLTMIVGSYSAAGSFFHRSTEYFFDRGGRVQVYQFANGNWSQLGADFTGESLYLGYGDEVRISGNGLVVAFTNYYWSNDHDGNKLHVYEWASNTWVERTGVSAFNNFNQMGSPFDFSINSNGSVLSAGRYSSFGGDGSVIIYRYANSSYSSEIISAESTNNMVFGYKVDLDDSGNYCVISENYSNISDSGNEHIYVYHYSGGQWSNIGKVSGGAISSWGSTETTKVVLSGNKNVVAAIVGGKVVHFL